MGGGDSIEASHRRQIHAEFPDYFPHAQKKREVPARGQAEKGAKGDEEPEGREGKEVEQTLVATTKKEMEDERIKDALTPEQLAHLKRQRTAQLVQQLNIVIEDAVRRRSRSWH